MAAPPINIFSQHRKPDEVLRALKDLIPNAMVQVDENGIWSSVKGTWKRGWLKSALDLEVTHSPAYYAGDGWSAQLSGMAGYFARLPDKGRHAGVYGYIPGLSFAVSFMLSPGTVEDDPRQEVVSAVARLLSGVIFLPGCLLDAEGRVIISAGDDPDPEARLPDHQPRNSQDPTAIASAEDDAPVEPPTAARVINRLILMGALVNRGFMEQHEEGKSLQKDSLADLQGTEAWSEGETDEVRLLQTPVGELAEKEAWKLPWLSEGAAVLAWALGRLELPAYDQQVDVQTLYDAIGAMETGGSQSHLRPAAEIEALSTQMLAIHWRLVQFSLDHQPMDFAEYATRAWFGPMELTLARLIENDLDIQGLPLSQAPDEHWTVASGIMEERRRAIHWLLGGHAVYSENDTST